MISVIFSLFYRIAFIPQMYRGLSEELDFPTVSRMKDKAASEVYLYK